MDGLPAAATRVLDEAGASGLALGVLPANTAKVRLVLDLASELPADGRLRILDAGCGGRNNPFNLWEPLLPLADRIELTGVDLAFLEETRARATELGFPVEVREGSVLELERQFGAEAFDAVASTQVLEHVEEWQEALRQVAAVLRPGGLLLLTCDSGELRRGPAERAKLAAKRLYARAPERLRHRAARVASGEWEWAPTRDELEAGARVAGLDVERCAHYALRDVKDAQGGPGTRLLALALEEALAEERPGFDPARYRILYLRARKPRPASDAQAQS